MNRGLYKPVWLMWLALPLTALDYWRAWDQFPMRMAVHFDANWQPTGYTSCEGALMLMLGLSIMAVLLVLFTVVGAHRAHAETGGRVAHADSFLCAAGVPVVRQPLDYQLEPAA